VFLHHTMTDSEILRTCEGCESTHLRLVSDRLRDRVQDLREINKLAQRIDGSFELRDIRKTAVTIVELSGER
jgi:hypothetical protein